METIGYHYIVEASGCNEKKLGDVKFIKNLFSLAAIKSKMTVKASHFFKFSPTGVSGAVIVAESHIAIHTWPEHKYAAIDVYTCGENSDPEKAVKYILKELECKEAHISEVERGLQDPEDKTFTHSIVTWEENLKKKRK